MIKLINSHMCSHTRMFFRALVSKLSAEQELLTLSLKEELIHQLTEIAKQFQVGPHFAVAKHNFLLPIDWGRLTRKSRTAEQSFHPSVRLEALKRAQQGLVCNM